MRSFVVSRQLYLDRIASYQRGTGEKIIPTSAVLYEHTHIKKPEGRAKI